MAQQIDVLKAQIVREDGNSSWGFRLEGGVDYQQPICILRVTPGSPASRIGLRAGDEVTEIGDVSTAHLTLQQATDLLKEHGLSIVITVERRAHGAVPRDPVVGREKEALKMYQTFDMSGCKPAPAAPVIPHNTASHTNYNYNAQPQPQVQAAATVINLNPQTRPPETVERRKVYQTFDMTGKVIPQPNIQNQYQFTTVDSKPFNPPPRRPGQPRYAAPQPQPQHHVPEPVSPSSPSHLVRNADYTDDSNSESGLSQSRTFKVLQSYMSNEEPSAGIPALPPARTITMDKFHEEEEARRRGSKDRVKVFMPQKYNTPMGMYSPRNVVDSFQSQAEGYFETLDQPASDAVEYTPAHQSVMHHDHNHQ